MKYPVKSFKDLGACLKELEPFVKNGEHLQTGKPFKKFGGLRSREILANWLICVAYNFTSQIDRLTFTTDPLGGDGVFLDTLTGETWPSEHVLVPKLSCNSSDDIEALISRAIESKRSKGGAAYAGGKTLVVFLNQGGKLWFPNKVARQLPKELYFGATWVVGLQHAIARNYVYDVTLLDISEGDAPVWFVHLAKGFDAWRVEKIQ